MYEPKPADTSEIKLPYHLIALEEQLAENVHDLWAVGRIKEGWVYGDGKDYLKKTSPHLVPYAELSESEKDYDRKAAMETLKLITKLGYKICIFKDDVE